MSIKSFTYDTKALAKEAAEGAYKRAISEYSADYGEENITLVEAEDAMILTRPDLFDGVVIAQFGW